MNKRQKQVQKSLLKDEAAVMNQLEDSYKEAIKEIDKVVASLLARNDTQNIQSIIYQVKYQTALKKELEALLGELHKRNYTTIDDYLHECYKNGHVGTFFDLQGQGVPLLIDLNQEEMVNAIALNSKLSAPLYNTLGYNVDALKVDVMREVSRGVAMSLSYQEIGRNLKNITGIDYNKAVRITRTEGHRVSQEAALNAQRLAISRGADVQKQWDSTLDSRTRPSHQKVDGEIVGVEEKFSNGLMFPGDPNGAASEVVNCRCCLLQRATWALTDEEFTKWNGNDKELQHFESVSDYEYFKKKFWKEVNK